MYGKLMDHLVDNRRRKLLWWLSAWDLARAYIDLAWDVAGGCRGYFDDHELTDLIGF